jgi:ubiquinone/menaquinone biosynthesis C-methylase UbiE
MSISEQQRDYWLDERHLAYHQRQFDSPYRSTMRLLDLIESAAAPAPGAQGLDVACGAGAALFQLGRRFPHMEWTGVDIAEPLFGVGAQLMRARGAAKLPRFVRGDAYRLSDYLPPRSFDLVCCLQTFLSVPEYEPLLGAVLAMAKPGGSVFILSLFSDALVDAKIELKQYHDERFEKFDGPFYYNVYSIGRFVQECRRRGAGSVEAVDFEIDQDLARPAHRHMGTYTERLADGRRLQISGPLLMPWKFAIVRMA